MARNGRDDRDGDGGDEGAGHVEDGLGHGVDAPLGIGGGLGHHAEQAAHVDLGFQRGEDLQTGRTQGDGNGDGQQLLCGGGEGLGGVVGSFQLAVAGAEFAPQVHAGYQTAHRNTQNCAAGGQSHGIGGLQEQHSQADAHNQFHHGLDDLGDGGGEHIAAALEVAPEGGHDADQQHAGTKAADGGPGIGLVLEGGQLAAEKSHQQAAGDA